MRIGNLFRAWKGFLELLRLPLGRKRILFYAEDTASRSHFDGMITELTDSLRQPVVYLTSCLNDPVLSRRSKLFSAYFIGSGITRVLTFLTLKADVMVMTMPDLETFEIRRSRKHPVHYVYVFHSMVSSHMIYRSGAFDHFDTVFCVGTHHAKEIRSWELKKGLPPKRLIEHGYGRLDLLRQIATRTIPRVSKDGHRIHVLLAPSWGALGLLETIGSELITLLVQSGFDVTVRPHPMTLRKWPPKWSSLRNYFDGNEQVSFDLDMAGTGSLERADIMISDWSGAALEFAFAWERPVVFVDVPRKVNNPDYELVDNEPIEVSIRSELGEIVDPNELHQIPEIILNLVQRTNEFKERIRAARKKTVFNLDRSSRAGAEALVALQNDLRQQQYDIVQQPGRRAA
jgi:hypothetical protein